MINLDFLKSKKINLTEENILDRLLDRYRWPKIYPIYNQPSIEAIREDGEKDQDFFWKDDYLDSEKCIKRYEEGYTLIFSKVNGFCKDTWIFHQLLFNTFKKECNCNFYFGNGKKSVSFDKHNHYYPVIVKNIFGESKWIIDEKEIILKDQDCIGFDEFIDHQVVEINSPKLSMTCNIN